jgi:predicted ArsR family transcriptional regulator
MAEQPSEELKQKILDYLGKVSKAKNRDVAAAVGVTKHEADNAINELAKEDKVEFLYLGTSYVALKGKYQQA